VAAFLGAGYRVPLAAVMFVAEATGRPGFIVPALLAAVADELVMGRSSVAELQVAAYDSST
jgi:CIC family chloride channel protein